MSAVVSQAGTAYRDYVVDGVSSSGPFNPSKGDIRALWILLGSILDALATAGGGGTSYTGYTTRALMNADLAHAANSIAEVIADGTPANNGIYLKSGASGSGSWSQVSTLTLAGINASLVTEAAGRASADALKADLASPALTGNPSAPTQPPGTNNTRIASTAYADAAVAVEVAARSAVDATQAPLASPALTGNPSAPTQPPGTNNTRIASTAYADAAVAVEVTARSAADNLKANLASPALTGNPTAPTQTALDNSTRLSTTAYTDAAVTAAGSGSSAAIASETSARIAADALKADLASPALTGNPTAPTQTALNNSTRLSTTAYADSAVSAEAALRTTAVSAEASTRAAADNLLAPLNSPALTGNPTAPTQAAGNNSTRLASTAYADGAVALIASKFTSVEGATLLEFADADDNIYSQFDVNGMLEVANLKSGDGQMNVLETTDGPALRVTDADDFVLFEYLDTTALSADVTAAHGTTASLTARLAVNTQDDGTMFSPYWGLWRMRQSRLKMSQLARGITGVQLVVSLLGDSQFNNVATAMPITQRLRAAYQTSGGGSIVFAPPYLRPVSMVGEYTTTMTGTWVEVQYTSPTLHIGKVSSSTAGGQVTIVGPGTGTLTSCSLVYVPTSNGQAQYRWNGGAWHAINLTTGFGTLAATTVPIANLPGTGFGTLEIQIVSGTISIADLDVHFAADGVRVNKLGASGATAAGWALQVVKPEWQTIMAATSTDLYVIQLSTNDQVSRTPAQIATDLLTIVTACRTTSPAADVLIMQSPENQNGRATLMSDITAAVRGMCVANKVPFLDLMYAFGDTVADYSVGSPHNWQSDLTHPDPDAGGDAGAELFYRALCQSI